MRRTVQYVAVTRGEGNAVDGRFSATCQESRLLMGFDRSEAGKEIGLMVFTHPAIVNLFRPCARCKPLAALKGCSSPDRGVWSLPGSKRERAEHPPGVHGSLRDNFVYEIYYSYNFVTHCLWRHCLSPSQPPVLVGKQVSKCHGTLLAMGKRE
jgi:hypothetical protein